MSLDIISASQLEPYDDEEEIQLMDTDETNLQLEEQEIISTADAVNKHKQEENTDNKTEEEEEDKVPSLVVIEVCFIIIKKHNLFIYLL